jgi:hypothetical protein
MLAVTFKISLYLEAAFDEADKSKSTSDISDNSW